MLAADPIQTARQIAARFAAALDAEDYRSAAALLTSDCTYETGTKTLIGRDAVVESYRSAGRFARQNLDAVSTLIPSTEPPPTRPLSTSLITSGITGTTTSINADSTCDGMRRG